MSRRDRIVVGLVGAVAGGKSTVSAFFRQLGATGADADAIGHDVLDRPAVRRAVARAFGRDVVVDGRVDRQALAPRVFAGAASLRRLNAIVHPHIARELRSRIAKSRGVFIVDAALLQETGADAWCDAVVYVDTPRRVRLARAASRGWPPGEMRRRERFQWSAAKKRSAADYVIDNSGSLADTERQVHALYDRFVRSLQP
jgi:dephospho-CoA kinase